MIAPETIKKFSDFLIFQRSLKPKSVQEYISEIRKFQDSENVSLLEIKNYADFSSHLIAYKKKKAHSDRTTYKIASMFKEFYDFCALHEIIDSPHFLSMGHGFKKGKSPEREFFDRDADKEILDKVLWSPFLNLRDRCIIFLLFSTGIRAGELCGLNIGDVDLERRWVHVRKDIGKGEKWRYVPFDETCKMWLSLYITGMGKIDLLGDDLPLFTTKEGSRMKPGSLWKLLNNLGNSFGEKINPHKWRHSLASFIVQKTDVTIAAKILGHESIQTTYGYTHIRPQTVKKIHDKIMQSS